ncbi:UTRA domain-containing protein [Streptococcus parasanguinis]|uniref:UTRA domain-containing protein n=1 Tax=Streptococcus parasanguinis TaxID=1318 RepID=UPI0039C4B35A
MKKYQHIYQILKEQIVEEKYLVGDFLPSENDLKEYYQVSRDTIRKALKLLQEEGFIETVQGMGAQICRQAHFDFPVSQLTSYQEIVKASGLQSETNVIRLEKITIDEKGAKKTGFPLHRLVWKVSRQRVVDGITSVLDIDYMDRELISGLTKEIAQRSIYQYIEEDLKLQIGYAKKEILISPIDNRDKILEEIKKEFSENSFFLSQDQFITHQGFTTVLLEEAHQIFNR